MSTGIYYSRRRTSVCFYTKCMVKDSKLERKIRLRVFEISNKPWFSLNFFLILHQGRLPFRPDRLRSKGDLADVRVYNSGDDACAICTIILVPWAAHRVVYTAVHTRICSMGVHGKKQTRARGFATARTEGPTRDKQTPTY